MQKSRYVNVTAFFVRNSVKISQNYIKAKNYANGNFS